MRQSDGTVPLPPSKVRVGYRRTQGKLVRKIKAYASKYAQHPALCGQVVKKRCTVPQGYRSARQDPVQNMYAVYKMRVISQNSRRKLITDLLQNVRYPRMYCQVTENTPLSVQATDYRGYCTGMYMLKQLKLPPHPVSQ